MAMNPPSSIVASMAAPVPAKFTKFTFRTLYIRRTDPGSKEMSQAGRPSDQLGRRNISDCPIYDGRGSNASLVGRIQGITVQIGNAHQLVTIVFETERYYIIHACMVKLSENTACWSVSFVLLLIIYKCMHGQLINSSSRSGLRALRSLPMEW
jgi:hypothetical protein